MSQIYKTILDTVVNIIFPPRCISCSEIILEPGMICAECWPKVEFVNHPCCVKCGIPFEYEFGPNVICLNCEQNNTYYERALFLFKYNDISKKIIHKLKYYDNTYLAKYLAFLAKRIISSNFPVCEIIIPVPLHRRKLMSRFYNQSALLAKEIGKLVNIEFNSSILCKVKHTVPQTTLTKLQRQENVKNTFILNKTTRKFIKDKTIFLIDDVITTGSTINECSKVLKAGGCKEVFVFTLARVLSN
jgi:ComF family protein